MSSLCVVIVIVIVVRSVKMDVRNGRRCLAGGTSVEVGRGKASEAKRSELPQYLRPAVARDRAVACAKPG